MADGTGGTPPPSHAAPAETGRAANLSAHATDWITIWQSELAAMATDREMQESWMRLVDLWAQAASTAARFLPTPPAADHGQAGRAGTAAPPWAKAAMAAPDARDAAIQHLAERVEELERQLRSLAAGPAGA